MANIVDAVVKVSPDTNETYRLDFNNWDVIGTNGDTMASAIITWGSFAPGTVGTPSASGTPDRYLHVHITGFAMNDDGTLRKYFATIKATSTGGAVEDFYVRFDCGLPKDF